MVTTAEEIAEAWRRERPGAPTRSIAAVAAIKHAARHLQRERERSLSAHGVDAATLDLLSTLRRSGPPYTLTTREIAEQSYITAGAVSQRIARAEQGDLVVRRSAPEGRTVLVKLTTAGHRLVDEVVDKVLAVDEQATASLSDAELAQLELLLARIG